MNNILDSAKTRLIITERFFASILLQLEYIEDYKHATAWTDGKKIGYNPKFFEEIGVDGAIEVLKHEVGHIILLHNLRKGDRDDVVWNVACDFVVNETLNIGENVPKIRHRILIDGKYKGWSAEKVYDDLSKHKKHKNHSDGTDSSIFGEVRQLMGSPAEIAKAEQDQKIMVNQAISIAKRAGKLPAFLEEFIKANMKEKINWKELFQNYFTQYCRNDYTWAIPNYRYLHTGFYLPSLRNNEIGDVVLVIDTSGSVTVEQLNEVFGEVHNACIQAQLPLRLIQCDCKIQEDKEITADDTDCRITVKGRGGTDYSVVFDYVADCDLLVYYTDGECANFGKMPDYPVIWIINNYSDIKFNPPFGHVIYVKQ